MMERLSALVLDGDPASLSTISETLAKFNFRVVSFQTAEAALDFIKCGAAKAADLDLVLVEVNLNNMAPGTSANPDLFHHILNELQVPLTAMCSRDDEEALSKCMNLGACFHLLKPLNRRSFSILWHQALEHKSKKAAPQRPSLNDSTKNRMVSPSTEKPKEVLILERNNLSVPQSNGYEEPKKQNRVTWTIELHEKFLEAVEALGGNKSARPEKILHLMNVKGLTVKHIGSHLQKHRLRNQNTKQGQRQENASRKPISRQGEATSESITPRVETDGEVYPSRLWTKVKKRSVDTSALKTGMHTCTSGNDNEGTESVWDRYENNLQVFAENKKRWMFTSEHQWPRRNNIDTTDEGDPNEAPETAAGASIEISGSSSLISDQVGEKNRVESDRDNNTVWSTDLLEGYGASIESSGSSSLLANDQVGENNHSEAARANDSMGNITLLEAYGGAYIGTSGSGSLLTGDLVRQNGCAEATRHNDNLWGVNLPQGYGAFTEISGSSNMLTSYQVGENNGTEFARDNGHMENISLLEVYGASIENAGSSSMLTSDQVGQSNLTEADRIYDTMGSINYLEGTVDPEYIAPMDYSVAWAHLEGNGPDLRSPSDGREEAYSFWMSQLAGPQDYQSLGPEGFLQVGDDAYNDALRSVGLVNVDEQATQGWQEQQSLSMEDLLQVDDVAWDDTLISMGLINLLDEPMAEEAAIGGSQGQQSLAPEVLQAGDNAYGDDLGSIEMVNLLNEPMTQEAAIADALVDDPMTLIAQDDVPWAWSPAVPGDYGIDWIQDPNAELYG